MGELGLGSPVSSLALSSLSSKLEGFGSAFYIDVSCYGSSILRNLDKDLELQLDPMDMSYNHGVPRSLVLCTCERRIPKEMMLNERTKGNNE